MIDKLIGKRKICLILPIQNKGISNYVFVVLGRKDVRCGITMAGVDVADLAVRCSRQGEAWDVLRLLELLCRSVPVSSSVGQRRVSQCVTSV